MVTSCSRSWFVVSICFLCSYMQTVRSLRAMTAAELCVNTAPSTGGSRFLGSAAEQPIINKWRLVCSKQKSSTAICQGIEEEGVTSPIRPMSLGILLIILIFFGKVMVPISFCAFSFTPAQEQMVAQKRSDLKSLCPVLSLHLLLITSHPYI